MATIGEIYKKVTEGGVYDYPFACKQQETFINLKIRAELMPEVVWTLLKNEKRGCCLNYALAMVHLLHSEGMEVYLATTPEANPNTGERTHMHASVCYLQNGEKFFANPVATVKDGKQARFQISLDEFKKEMLLEGECISIFDLYGENKEKLFFGDFTFDPKEKIS